MPKYSKRSNKRLEVPMNTDRLDKTDEDAILACVDENFCNLIDLTVRLNFPAYDSLNAKAQRKCKWEVIKSLLPDLFLSIELESTKLTRKKVSNICGRIYTMYLINRLLNKGIVIKFTEEGNTVCNNQEILTLILLISGKIKLSDI